MKTFSDKLHRITSIADIVLTWFVIYIPLFIIVWAVVDLARNFGEEVNGLVYSLKTVISVLGCVIVILASGFLSGFLVSRKIN